MTPPAQAATPAMASATPDRRSLSPRQAALGLAMFVALSIVYMVSPVRQAFDSRWSVYTAMSLLQGHGGDISAYAPLIARNGAYAIQQHGAAIRTVYPVGVSVLAIPAVLVATWTDPGFAERLHQRIPDKFERIVASLIAAASCVLFWRVLLVPFPSGGVALAGAAVFALGSPMWSTASRALWQHGPMVLFLLGAMLVLLRAATRPHLAQYAGPLLAAAYLMRPTAALPIVVFSAYVLLRHRAVFLRYLAGAMLMGLPWLAFNQITLGQILPDYYLVASGASTSSPLLGLAGELFSPARGLLVYCPVFALAAIGFALAWRDRPRRPLHAAFALVVVAHLALVAQWPNWWGGHSYGPRLLTDIVPYLAYFTASAFAAAAAARPRRAWRVAACTALALLSVAMQAPGALSLRTLQWNVAPENVDAAPERLWDWTDPPFLRPWR